MQTTRALPFAVIITAATAIAVTMLPWLSINVFGYSVSWNGLGMAQGAGGVVEDGPAGRGWYVVAAAIVAILAGLMSLVTVEQVRTFAPLFTGIAGIAAVAAAIVPLVILVRPSWYLGDFAATYGLPDDIGVSKPILSILIIILLALGALCLALSNFQRATQSPGGLD